MAKKKVYEDILNRYTSLRSEYLKKEADAERSIEDARNHIRNNSELMAEAVAAGDQQTYIKLHTETARYKADIQFFEELLERLHSDSAFPSDDIHTMLSAAKEEESRIKKQFNEEIEKMIQPIIEYAERINLELELLRLAQNKISINLAHGKYGRLNLFDYTGIPALPVLNNLKKNLVFKEIRTDAESKAREEFQTEVSRWI